MNSIRISRYIAIKKLFAALLRVTAAFATTFCVLREFRHISKAARKAFKQLLMKLAVRRRKGVVHPQAILACRHQTSPSEIGKVPRDFGLGTSDNTYQITHAKLTGLEEV
jgi:hypothetical protein